MIGIINDNSSIDDDDNYKQQNFEFESIQSFYSKSLLSFVVVVVDSIENKSIFKRHHITQQTHHTKW